MVEKPGDPGDKACTRVRDESLKKGGTGGKQFQAWNGCRAYKKPVIQQVKFEGKCTDLKGHIYDCSDSRQADICTRTTKEIVEYFRTSYKYGSDMRLAVYNLKASVLEKPGDPEDETLKADMWIWEKDIDESYIREKKCLKENLKTLYSLVWGQCSDVMCDQSQDWSSQRDSIGLLQVINGIIYNFQSEKYRPMARHEAMRRFYFIYQDKYLTCAAYLKKFQNSIEVLEHCGGIIRDTPGLINMMLVNKDIDPVTATKAHQMAATRKMTHDTYVAVAFIPGANRHRYGG
jgi:hypothetical protein